MMDVRTLASTLSALAQLRNATRQRPAVRSIAIGTVCLILAMWAGIAVIGCAAVALWSYELPYAGPVATPLIVAGAFVLVGACLVVTGIALFAKRPVPVPEGPTMAEQAQKIGEQLAHALPSSAELTQLVKNNAGTLVVAALVAGMVSGSKKK